jgi:DTW domain-containing protein YfiP
MSGGEWCRDRDIEAEAESPWCIGCRQWPHECICDRLPVLPNERRLIVLQHRMETGRQSNTGSLAKRWLQHSELVLYGDLRHPIDRSLLTSDDGNSCLLYPQAEAPILEAGSLPLRPGRVPSIVVIDSTWRQARRIYRRVHALRSMPTFRLPPSFEPRWKLRKPRSPGALNTIEAVAAAFEILGELDVARGLIAGFDAVAPGVLDRRGRGDLVAERAALDEGTPEETGSDR